MKPELTSEQLEILQQLIKLANVGCMREITCLNERQIKVTQDLKKSGYVMMTKKKFMVLMPA
jgi:hypothetical protein